MIEVLETERQNHQKTNQQVLNLQNQIKNIQDENRQQTLDLNNQLKNLESERKTQLDNLKQN